MRRIMISAMESGSGKTVLACGLMQAFRSRGLSVEAYKCGPDFIDPLFHRRVLGLPSSNLDLWLQGREGVRQTLARQQAELAVIEGAMGFYDGINGTDRGSAWELAASQRIPVLLVLRPGGSSLTLAAQVKGVLSFRQPCPVTGLFLTDCKPGLYAHLRPILEKETGLCVAGYLPPLEEARLESRHLGLITAGEIAGLEERFCRIGKVLEETARLDRILELAAGNGLPSAAGNYLPFAVENCPPPAVGNCTLSATENCSPPSGRNCPPSATGNCPALVPVTPQSVKEELAWTTDVRRGQCRIAVAMDEGFLFYYRESLDRLSACGAELVYFSPIHDTGLPEGTGGLYLGGGYPELYAKELSANLSMRTCINRAIRAGMPAVAECGGFLYLSRSLEGTDGVRYPMAGVLPGDGYRTGGLVRFGYASLKAEQDSMLFRRGETIPVHEFHHWDSTCPGTDLTARKPSGKTWTCGYAGPTLYAGFPHLHLGGELPLAERFVNEASR